MSYRPAIEAVIVHVAGQHDDPGDRKTWTGDLNHLLVAVERVVFLSGHDKAFSPPSAPPIAPTVVVPWMPARPARPWPSTSSPLPAAPATTYRSSTVWASKCTATPSC